MHGVPAMAGCRTAPAVLPIEGPTGAAQNFIANDKTVMLMIAQSTGSLESVSCHKQRRSSKSVTYRSDRGPDPLPVSKWIGEVTGPTSTPCDL